MRKHPPRAYYKTFSLKHGPSILAIPVAAPRGKYSPAKRRQLDADGITYSILEDYKSFDVYKLEVRHLIYSTLANDINLRHALQEKVEGRLESLVHDGAALKEQLDRIERKLDAAHS